MIKAWIAINRICGGRVLDSPSFGVLKWPFLDHPRRGGFRPKRPKYLYIKGIVFPRVAKKRMADPPLLTEKCSTRHFSGTLLFRVQKQPFLAIFVKMAKSGVFGPLHPGGHRRPSRHRTNPPPERWWLLRCGFSRCRYPKQLLFCNMRFCHF